MSKIEADPTMIIKLIFIGEIGVGKTSLLRREADKSFT
jgi:GTPase SAR1 family protein